MADDKSDLGCAVSAIGVPVLGLILITVVVATESCAPKETDALLKATHCADEEHPSRAELRNGMEISPEMTPGRCVRSYGTVSFVNRLAGDATLCVGFGGVCQDGHPLARQTLKPGVKTDVEFPIERRLGFGRTRYYPVTVTGPGMPPVDFIVQATPETPDPV